MHIVKNRDLLKKYKQVNPITIATAFIGRDFVKFFRYPKNVKNIQKIVISSAFVNDPEAIKILIEEIGWEKIFFNKKLHSKIYIGRNSALVTSANLTRNGFYEQGLLEIGILIDSKEDLKELESIVNSYIDPQQTKTEKLKIFNAISDKFSKLPKNKLRNGIKIKNKSFKTFYENKDYRFYNNKIKFVWWDTYLKKLGLKKEISLNFLWENYNFQDLIKLDSEKQKVSENDWLLCYKLKTENSKYEYHKNAKDKLEWLHLNKILKKISVTEYKDIGLENKNNINIRPFNIDYKFRNAFKELIESKKYKNYFMPNRNDIVLKMSSKKFSEILTFLYKKYIRK